MTKPDSSIAYGLSNYRGKRVKVTTRIYRNRLTIADIEEV